MPKNWETEEIIQLIELYETNTVLWDVKSPEYRDKTKKNEIYEEIGSRLGCNGDEIKRKIHNLRNQVSQELKKINKKSGSGIEEYRSTWPYFNLLKFIIPGLTASSPQSNLTSQTTKSSNIGRGNDEAENEKNDKNELPLPSPVKKKKKVERDDFETINTALKLIQKSDEYDSFGEYVATELRTLRSDFIRRRLKSEIRKAIVRAADDDDMVFSFGSMGSNSTQSPVYVPSSAPDSIEQQSAPQSVYNSEVTKI